ncbi:MAG TPA: carboxypeptidase-like regulatory domain-containing protein, partial [Flavisolibacter sp.]|nr:carboxypeptidase-like regulatory domain-containing protein [Flavisolibacter sp.]
MKSACLKLGMFTSFLLFVFAAWSQTIKVSGRVISGEDNKPMTGVSIVVKGKPLGVQTDGNGSFSISLSSGDRLVFSYAGYGTQEIPVSNSSPLEVVLRPATAKMDEVVVVGYGTQTRKTLTGAVSSVSPISYEHSPSTNVATALQGTVPGLIVQQSTGQPGSSPSIVFRGGSDFSGSGSPLYVVDGVVVPNLYGLDMNDVASIDLLKDAASTAIYGARAANGVVLVTTKKGKRGKTQATYSFSSTSNYVRRNPSEYLNAAQYIRLNRMGLRARYLGDSLDNNTNAMNTDKGQLTGSWGWAVSSGWASPIGLYTTQLISAQNRKYLNDPSWHLLVDQNPFAPGQMDSILYKELSVQQREDMILQPSSTTEHNFSFSGANEQGNYALSLGTSNDQGIIINSWLKRWNMNFNGGLNVGKNLKINSNISAYTVNQSLPYTDPIGSGAGGLMQRFIGVAPTVRYTNDTSGVMLPGPNDVTLGNPAYWSTLYVNSTNQQRFLGGVNLEYSILPYLKFLASGSGYFLYTTNNFF